MYESSTCCWKESDLDPEVVLDAIWDDDASILELWKVCLLEDENWEEELIDVDDICLDDDVMDDDICCDDIDEDICLEDDVMDDDICFDDVIDDAWLNEDIWLVWDDWPTLEKARLLPLLC